MNSDNLEFVRDGDSSILSCVIVSHILLGIKYAVHSRLSDKVVNEKLTSLSFLNSKMTSILNSGCRLGYIYMSEESKEVRDREEAVSGNASYWVYQQEED